MPIPTRRRRYPNAPRITAFLLALAAACTIQDQGRKLGAPIRTQEQQLYCGPASVLMWRLYDHLPEISQAQIAFFMGGAQFGVKPEAIRSAVVAFTNTFDADDDLVAKESRSEFIARQITSIDGGRPVIVITEQGFHAVLLDGGKWYRDSNNFKVWDFVYVNNPRNTFPDEKIYADLWIQDNCFPFVCRQIIGHGVSASWQSNLTTQGPSVRLRSSRGCIQCPQEW